MTRLIPPNQRPLLSLIGYGANGAIVVADSTQTYGVKWAMPNSLGFDHGSLSGLTDDDHSQYVYTTPGVSSRNVVQPTDITYTPLTLRQGSSGTATSADLILVCEQSDGGDVFAVKTSNVAGSNQVDVYGNLDIHNEADGTIGAIRIYEGSGGTNYWKLITAASLSGNRTLTLPDDQGSIRKQLRATDSSGTVAWDTILPTGTSPPSSPQAGDAYWDTTDQRAYYYDSTRAHWFSQEFWSDFGKNGTPSDGEVLLSHIVNIQVNTSRGHIPFSDLAGVTITGMECRTNGTFTGSFEIMEGATATGITVAHSASDQEESRSLDHDFDTTEALGVRINISSGTPTIPTCRVFYRIRKS